MGHERKAIFVLCLLVALSVAPAGAQNYVPSGFAGDYPLVFHWEQSDSVDAHVAERTGTASFADVSKFEKPYSIGPPGDYDGDDSIEYPVRSQNGAPYLKFYTRSGTRDFSLSRKPKSSSMLAAGYLDRDGKTDLLFKNQNGFMSAVDSDGRSTEFKIPSFGDPIGTADIDKDGEVEIVYSDSSANVKYYDIDSSSSTNIDPGNDKAGSYSNLVDVDGDSRLEYSYSTGSSTAFTADIGGSEEQIGSLSSAKVAPQAILYTGSDLKFFISGNSNNVEVCTLSSCQRADRKSSGARTVIPPLVQSPVANASQGSIDQGSVLKARFNATDFEGYSDIVNSEASITFRGPEGFSKTVSAGEITAKSGVSGSFSSGNLVPDDGKTKSFEAEFRVPPDAETGTWQIEATVKDGKMTGTTNVSTFQVEKALVRKNISQSLSVSRGNTLRSTDLEKTKLTRLSLSTPGITESSTGRRFKQPVGYSPGNSRFQRLRKELVTGLAFPRSRENTKTTFQSVSSALKAVSTLSDVYSSETLLSSVFEASDSSSTSPLLDRLLQQDLEVNSSDTGLKSVFSSLSSSISLTSATSDTFSTSAALVSALSVSSSVSDSTLFTGSMNQDLEITSSQEKGFFTRALDLALGVAVAPERSVGIDRERSVALDTVSSRLTSITYSRSFTPVLSVSPVTGFGQTVSRLLDVGVNAGLNQIRSQGLRRTRGQSITGSFRLSPSVSLERDSVQRISSVLSSSRSETAFLRQLNQGFSAGGGFDALTGRAVSLSLGVSSVPSTSESAFIRGLSSRLLTDASSAVEFKSPRSIDQSFGTGTEFSATGRFFAYSTQGLILEDSVGDLAELSVSLAQSLGAGSSLSSAPVFDREENLDVNISESLGRGFSGSRVVLSGFAAGIDPQAVDGAVVFLDQALRAMDRTDSRREFSRSDSLSLDASIGLSLSRSFVRGISQPVGISFGLQELIDFVTEFLSPDPQDQDAQDGDSDDGSDGGSGGGSSDGLGTSTGFQESSRNDSALDTSNESDPGGEVPGSDSPEDESRNSSSDTDPQPVKEGGSGTGNGSGSLEVLQAGLNPSNGSRSIQKLSQTVYSIQAGERFMLDVSGNETGASGPDTDSSALQSITVRSSESRNEADIRISTADTAEILNISGKGDFYGSFSISTDLRSSNLSVVYRVDKSDIPEDTSIQEITVSLWDNSTKLRDLRTEILNASETSYALRAYSSSVSGTFTVGAYTADSSPDPGLGSAFDVSMVPWVELLKMAFIISAVYILRSPIFALVFTADLRIRYVLLSVSYRLLRLHRRYVWRRRSDVGSEELSLAQDVTSLENELEALKYRKEDLERSVERRKEDRERYRRKLSVLSGKIQNLQRNLET